MISSFTDVLALDVVVCCIAPPSSADGHWKLAEPMNAVVYGSKCSYPWKINQRFPFSFGLQAKPCSRGTKFKLKFKKSTLYKFPKIYAFFQKWQSFR